MCTWLSFADSTDDGGSEELERTVFFDELGNRLLSPRLNRPDCIGFVHIFYCNRALEWISVQEIFRTILQECGSVIIDDFEKVVFGWRYMDKVGSLVYKPKRVFTDFELENESCMNVCSCMSLRRFASFLDPETANDHTARQVHVRTMDCGIIRHTELRKLLSKGMNHIPLQPTPLQPVVTALCDGFKCLIAVLKKVGHSFPDSWIE